MNIATPRGALYHTKGGNVRLKWDDEFTNKWEWAYSETQKFIDSEVLRLSNPYIPFQSSMLQKSGILGTVIGSGEVIFNAPYARYLYYGKVMIGEAPKELTDIDIQFHGAPMRGAFWFERMKQDKKTQILKGAAKIAGGTK